MKAALNLFLSITLLVTTCVPSWAVTTPTSPKTEQTQQVEQTQVSAKDFKKVVNGVVYSLENIDDVIKALMIQDNALSAAVSQKVSHEVMLRVGTAIELVEAIILDEKMEQIEKKKYVDQLDTALGSIFFRVIRHHGEDKVDPNKTIEEMARTGFFGVVMTALREFYLDAKATVTFPQDPDGVRIWGQLERRNRETLGQNYSRRLMEYAHNTLSQLEPDARLRNHEIEQWTNGVIKPSITLRRARLGAQRFTAAVGFGAAFLALQTGWPFPFDFVGLATHHSEHSYEFSGYIESLFFLGAATIKALTISGKTVNVLEATAKAFENPDAPIPDLNLNESLSQKIARLLPSSKSKQVNKCETDVGLLSKK